MTLHLVAGSQDYPGRHLVGEEERLSDRLGERLRCKWCGRLTRCHETAPSISYPG